MTLESIQSVIRTAIQSAMLEQIEDLQVQEEEAREAGQEDYADGIAQVIGQLAENFDIELPEEEETEEEETKDPESGS